MIGFDLVSSQRQLEVLEDKVGILEKDLNKNHNIINQLKDALKVISNGGPNPKLIAPGGDPEDNVKGDPWVFHQRADEGGGGGGDDRDDGAPLNLGAKAHVNQMECSFAAGESGTSADIQVFCFIIHLFCIDGEEEEDKQEKESGLERGWSSP